MHLLLMGPPGAGKGTQAKLLAQTYNYAHISTGDLFRENLKSKTKLGELARTYMEAGEYVPDAVTTDMLSERLTQDDVKNGFILDGYPRTDVQIVSLDELLEQKKIILDAVIEITADIDELVERLLKRADLEGRLDDTEDVVRNRFDVYTKQTAPILAIYKSRNIHHSVDGMNNVDSVHKSICDILNKIQEK